MKKSSSTSQQSTAPATTKKSHSTVPSSNNCNAAAIATTMNAANLNNFLTSSLTLQSLAMQYSQSDMGYPITTTSSMSYRPDLSLITASNASMYSMEFLQRLAIANNQFVPSYKKATSPPKKQSPSPGFSQRSTTPSGSSQRSTTPSSQRSTTPSANSFAEAKKSEKKDMKAKYNDVMKIDQKISELMKIDNLVNANAANAAKNKKEHHMLNHISQYNKHYSHKTEKRKSVGHERKENHEKSLVNTHRSLNSAPPSVKGSPCEVLDLSPNKTIKSDKPETVVYPDYKNEIVSISAATAKDHNYWSSMKKEDEEKQEKSPTLSLIQRSINTAVSCEVAVLY